MSLRARTPSLRGVDLRSTVLRNRHQAPAISFSSAFDNAAWTKNRCSVVADATPDPFGLSRADSIVEDATASSTHYVQMDAVCSASLTSRFSVYAKAGTRSWICLGDATSSPGAYVNLATGVVGTINAGAGVIIVPMGNGWFWIRVTAVFANSAIAIYLASGNNSPVYSGNGTGNVYLFGADSRLV